MTIPEAARLVLQAAAIGDSGQVLVLDMGEPVKIVDLARTLIRLAGRSEREIRIEFTGLRPGEKLFEELLADNEATVATAVPRLRIARLAVATGTPSELLALAIDGTIGVSNRGDEAIRAALRRAVPEYAQ